MTITSKPICRACGCTEDDACLEAVWLDAPIFCGWAEPDLCTACKNGGKLRGPVRDHRVAPAEGAGGSDE